MTATLALALAAVWQDPTGRLRCEVPDAYQALRGQPWRFARADGLRQVTLLTVRPVPVGPAERARQLLERTGAAAIVADGNTARGRLEQTPPLAAAFSVASTEPIWAGVLVLGPAAAAVAAEAAAIAASCRRNTPSVAQGRIWDTTRRLSASLPPGHEGTEVRGAGAVQTPGYTIRMSAVQPMKQPSLEAVAVEWLKPSGAVLQRTSGAAAGPRQLPVVVATGTLTQGGVEYVIEVAAIELGGGEVGGLAVSTTVAAAPSAQATLDALLATVTLEPRP